MSAPSTPWAAWATKADHDFRNIQLVTAGNDPPWDTVAFDAQQGAEKYLKAFLIFRGQQPPKIHDLAELVDRCAAIESSFAELRNDAAFLSPLAVYSRYPDEPQEPSREDAERGVRIAERIREHVRSYLAEH
jgi:HEPN domain-containing protein